MWSNLLTRWFLGPILATALWTTGTSTANLMAGIITWVVAWWITQPIPLAITGIWGVVLSVLLGVVDPATAFSGFSHKVTLLLLGTFVIAQAMRLHGADRAVASWVLSRRIVRRSPKAAVISMLCLSGLSSWWFSSAATLAMLVPIAACIFSGPALGRVLLGIAYAAPLGGIAFPLGANPNILAIGILDQQLGIHVSLWDWMKPGLCVSVLSIAFVVVLMFSRVKISLSEQVSFRSFSAPQRVVMSSLLLLTCLWVFPKAMHESVAALLVACLLFIVPYRSSGIWRPTLSWDDVKEMDWSVIIVVATGISLGAAIFKSGLATNVGQGVAQLLGDKPSFAMVATLVLGATFLVTLVTSNTATGELMIPLGIGIVKATGQPVLPLVMGIAMIASIGVTIPAATPCVAIAVRHPSVKRSDALRFGFATDCAAFLVILGVVMLMAR